MSFQAKSNVCTASICSYSCKHHAGNVMQVSGIGEKEEEHFKFSKNKTLLIYRVYTKEWCGFNSE
jgi:hypothetical protein